MFVRHQSWFKSIFLTSVVIHSTAVRKSHDLIARLFRLHSRHVSENLFLKKNPFLALAMPLPSSGPFLSSKSTRKFEAFCFFVLVPFYGKQRERVCGCVRKFIRNHLSNEFSPEKLWSAIFFKRRLSNNKDHRFVVNRFEKIIFSWI